MRNLIFVFCLGLAYLLLPVFIVAQESGAETESYSLWIGGHYTDFKDGEYAKKAGEYNLGADEFLPEFRINYLSRTANSFYSLDGHYYDDKNIMGAVKSVVGDQFKGEFYYRSLVAQKGRDLLENLSAKKGPKMLTHEMLDTDSDYYTHRHEISGKVDYLVSRKNNVRLLVAHRSIIRKGSEQKIASNHCFSCHQTSRSAAVDKRTHQFEAGLSANAAETDLGYIFGYRHFESKAPEPAFYYDNAQHPTMGHLQDDFGSRLIYEDAVATYGVYPTVEKTSHKVRMKRDVGKGSLAGAVSYSRAKNKKSDLTHDAWSGTVSYKMPLSTRMIFVARGYGLALDADEVAIDLPTHREGVPGPVTSFDYTRYSALKRSQQKVTAELISRLTPKATVSVLLGYNRIDRDFYPVMDGSAGLETKQFIGQAKLRWRKGLKYSSNVKYRFEKTSDPFTSGRGLFESRGRGVILPLGPAESGYPAWVFYFQREGLRYQNITTVPTDYHRIEWSSTWRPTNKYTVNLGLKATFDKNNDLDSLDVKHTALQPNIALNLMPNNQVTLTAGYTYNYDKSRGPVAVPLFDG